MAHSCVVNVQLSFRNDTTMVVKSTVPIEEGEGIFVSYIDTLQTTLQRRQGLAESKHFICRCRRCLDPTEFGTLSSAIKCKCTSYILPTTTTSSNDSPSLQWICSGCNEQMNQEEVNRIEKVSQNIIVKSMQRLPADSNTIDFCENILLTMAKKLHPNHVLLIQLRLYLVRLYGVFPVYSIAELSSDVLQRKKQLCIDLLNTLWHLCPGHSRLRGIVLYELHVPRVALAKKDFENGRITHDQFISELKDIETALKEAIQILIDEPFDVCSEGYIAKTALTDLKQLKDCIDKLETKNEVNCGVSFSNFI